MLRQIWGPETGKPHSVELRERAVAIAEQGNTHTQTARRLCVSIKFVNDMVRHKRETGAPEPKPQGNAGYGKPSGVWDCARARITARPEPTIDDLTAKPGREHGLDAHRFPVGRLPHRLGLSHKKDQQALEQKRKDVADLRRIRIAKRQPFMPAIWNGLLLSPLAV